jgi:hypothetical protein
MLILSKWLGISHKTLMKRADKYHNKKCVKQGCSNLPLSDLLLCAEHTEQYELADGFQNSSNPEGGKTQ